VTAEQDRRGALEAVERILNRGGDADDVLRAVVEALVRVYPYAAVWFVEDGELVRGPESGAAGAPAGERVDVVFGGTKVGELEAAGAGPDDRAFLERVATLVSAHVMVGWDTGGEAWEP
jgi:hypothetical protein